MKTRNAFTLLEVLAVIVIIASLASIIYPVFPEAVAAAKRTTCLSNLMQIGHAVAIYQTDNDDHYPYAINAVELAVPGLPLGRSNGADPHGFPLITQAVAAYVNDQRLWVCPMDTGRSFGNRLVATPHFFTFNGGSSYFTMDLLQGQTSSSWSEPTKEAYAFDASEAWHSPDPKTLDDTLLRHNLLYYDGHVANTRLADGGPTYIP